LLENLDLGVPKLEKHFSRKELADKLGVDPSAIDYYLEPLRQHPEF